MVYVYYIAARAYRKDAAVLWNLKNIWVKVVYKHKLAQRSLLNSGYCQLKLTKVHYAHGLRVLVLRQSKLAG